MSLYQIKIIDTNRGVLCGSCGANGADAADALAYLVECSPPREGERYVVADEWIELDGDETDDGELF